MIWQKRIEESLVNIRANDQYRQRRITQMQDQGRMIEIDGECYLNFSSNDYLGLSQAPQLIEAWQEGAEKYGIGSAGSGHIIGYNRAIYDCEARLADWLGYERAILFPSGYTANQAVIGTLIERDDHIIADRLSHASIMEAAMKSSGRLRRFHHNDLESLVKRLRPLNDDDDIDDEKGGALVITEGLFSMDGDEAPLDTMNEIIKAHKNHWLMVDDAHGIGVNGDQGRGTANQYGIHPDILVVTFGKAFGMNGAAVLMNHDVAEYFVQKCRPLIYSTAVSPAQAYTLTNALMFIEGEEGEDRRKLLRHNIDYFRRGLASIGREPLSESAIQPIIIGDNEKALTLANRLQAMGIWVTAIRPPTVPPNGARLRLTLTANHTDNDIDQLLEALNNAT